MSETDARRTGSDLGLVSVLEHGSYTAHVSALGAALRGLRHAGRDLAVVSEGPVPTPPYAGVVLAPWPNRIADGRYRGPDGSPQQLPVNETDRGNALHGLALWEQWRVTGRTESVLELEHVLHARPGYPHTLRLEVRYELTDHGLEVRLRASNLGASRAPVGLSVHPYLTVGDGGLLDEWSLQLPCRDVIETDDRLLPLRTVPVARAELDFVGGARLGPRLIDHAFGDVLVDGEGRARARVTNDDGQGVEVTWDGASRWVQVYTLDAEHLALHRRAVAIEPMTCAPDAFNSGAGLTVLEPDEHVEMWCRIAAVGPDVGPDVEPGVEPDVVAWGEGLEG